MNAKLLELGELVDALISERLGVRAVEKTTTWRDALLEEIEKRAGRPLCDSARARRDQAVDWDGTKVLLQLDMLCRVCGCKMPKGATAYGGVESSQLAGGKSSCFVAMCLSCGDLALPRARVLVDVYETWTTLGKLQPGEVFEYRDGGGVRKVAMRLRDINTGTSAYEAYVGHADGINAWDNWLPVRRLHVVQR